MEVGGCDRGRICCCRRGCCGDCPCDRHRVGGCLITSGVFFWVGVGSICLLLFVLKWVPDRCLLLCCLGRGKKWGPGKEWQSPGPGAGRAGSGPPCVPAVVARGRATLLPVGTGVFPQCLFPFSSDACSEPKRICMFSYGGDDGAEAGIPGGHLQITSSLLPSSYCKHVTTYEESNFSLSYQFIINLFSFLLRIKTYFLHEEVSLIEKRLFKTKYSKPKTKPSRSRKVRK